MQDQHTSIEAARQLMQRAQSLSTQGSYARRSPASQSLPYYIAAREKLEQQLQDHGESIERLRLLSLIEEALLNYPTAIQLLERAITLCSGPSPKDLKRLYSLKQHNDFWKRLCLTPSQLEDLGGYLQDNNVSAAERDYRFTTKWLALNQITESQRVLDALGDLGAFSDYQMLVNVVRG